MICHTTDLAVHVKSSICVWCVHFVLRAAWSAAVANLGTERYALGVTVQLHSLQSNPDADLPPTLPHRLQRPAWCSDRLRQDCRCRTGDIPHLSTISKHKGSNLVVTEGLRWLWLPFTSDNMSQFIYWSCFSFMIMININIRYDIYQNATIMAERSHNYRYDSHKNKRKY